MKPKGKVKGKKGKQAVIQTKKSLPQKQTTKGKLSVIAIPALIVILAVTFFSFLPSFENEFTNWDDNKYVLENPMINSFSFDNIKSIFSTYHMGNYHPLTMLSFVMDYKLSDTTTTVSPFMFHLTNIILHLLNTLLVFFFVYSLFVQYPSKNKNNVIWLALTASFVFGVSTMHVESVTWISERKDVLYSFFFIASLWAYVKYVGSKKNKFYIFSMLAFVLSLFSKGQAVSLSVTIIAIDFLLGRKLLSKNVILEKIPFLVLSLLFGLVAINAQGDAGAINYTVAHSFGDKLVFSCYAFVQYWAKLIYPTELSALYTYPTMTNGIPAKYWLSLIPFMGIIGLLIYTLIKKHKQIAFAILFFSINIFLVLQFLQVGGAVMSDRYSYIPSIGYAILAGLLIQYFANKSKALKYVAIIGLTGYCILLSNQTYARTQVWKNSLTLWDDVLSKHQNSAEAWVNRGNYKYKEIKDYPGALFDFDQALKIKDDLSEALTGRGVAKRNLGDLNGAMADYNKALKIKPNESETYSNRGVCKAMMNDLNGAIDDFNKSLDLRPNNAMAVMNRGGAKFKLQQFDDAIVDFNMAIKLDPLYAEAYSNRASAKYSKGDSNSAVIDYDKAISLNPKHVSAYFNKGLVLQKQEAHRKAIPEFSTVINLSHDKMAYFSRGMSYLSIGDKDLACNDFQKALELGYTQAKSKIIENCQFEKSQ